MVPDVQQRGNRGQQRQNCGRELREKHPNMNNIGTKFGQYFSQAEYRPWVGDLQEKPRPSRMSQAVLIGFSLQRRGQRGAGEKPSRMAPLTQPVAKIDGDAFGTAREYAVIVDE